VSVEVRSIRPVKTVLIDDDVATTGTQLDAVAACLLDDGGAARVEGIVLARALWRGRSS
jgi:predicted amidophosphoribosyltransferase